MQAQVQILQQVGSKYLDNQVNAGQKYQQTPVLHRLLNSFTHTHTNETWPESKVFFLILS